MRLIIHIKKKHEKYETMTNITILASFDVFFEAF